MYNVKYFLFKLNFSLNDVLFYIVANDLEECYDIWCKYYENEKDEIKFIAIHNEGMAKSSGYKML